MRITFISDTHNKYKVLDNFLPGGDLLIHSGDATSRGWMYEIIDFLEWFNGIDSYTNKVFIAGNHDFGFQTNPDEIQEFLKKYPSIIYLQDSMCSIDGVKIWGSPWQPRFGGWAFNADRGEEIKQHWDKIPNDIDILVTHGPSYGFLDKLQDGDNLGCEELHKKICEIKPKIHAFGHIHDGRGYVTNKTTHFINASVLNEDYIFNYKPITINWDSENNSIDKFIDI